MMFEHWLVVTDLDGTLLNHHDYRVDAALPVLRQLEQENIPVIFNTSKTLAEMQKLVCQLDNRHPFIVENGSAIVIPKHYFADARLPISDTKFHATDSYDFIVMGTDIETIQLFLHQVRPRAIDFSSCTVKQAMEITGLSEAEARAAQSRQFSVPLLFRTEEEEMDFTARATADGFTTLKGGRFLHVLGDCDKGKSMLALRKLYRQAQEFGVIALGDSPNDLDMLVSADRAVVVRSPSSHRLNADHGNIFFTRQSAPEGWVEGVQVMLDLDRRDKIHQLQ